MLPEPWRIVGQTNRFVVLMGLGPIIEGYVIIITRPHLSCCAAISEEWLDEFECLIKAVQEAQVTIYGASLFFEHGRTGSCVPEGHGQDVCYHAHLHLLPINLDLKGLVAEDYTMRDLKAWTEVRGQYVVNDDPYILVQDRNLIGYVAAPEKLPKRYLRTKVAAVLSDPVLADWEAFPSYNLVRCGKRRLGSELKRSITKQLMTLDEDKTCGQTPK